MDGRRRKALRGEGQRLPVTATIGKAGLSDGALANLEELLGNQSLVKVRLPVLPPPERKALAGKIATRLGVEHVGGVGRNILLYREIQSPEG